MQQNFKQIQSSMGLLSLYYGKRMKNLKLFKSKNLKLFVKIFFFNFSMIFTTVGEVKSSTVVTVSQDDVSDSIPVVGEKKQSTDTTFYRKPSFNGGDPEVEFPIYIYSNAIYPEAAGRMGVTGRVAVEFTIDVDGSLIDAKVISNTHKVLNTEALRVINSSPKWEPGIQKGKPVRAIYIYPVNFGVKSIPKKPTEKPSAVFAGKIVFGGSDFVSEEGISFSDTVTSGIEITLRNTVTYDAVRFLSDEDGSFYVTMQEGRYQIERLYLKKEQDDGAWAYVYVNPLKKILKMKSGKENNIGIIHWSYFNKRGEVKYLDPVQEAVDLKNFPAQIGVVNPVGTHGRKTIHHTYNLSLNLLTGKVGGVKGLEISGLWSNFKGDVYGLQIAGLSNDKIIDMKGIQIAGLGNGATDSKGIQIGGLGNFSDEVKGIQLGGFFNGSYDVSGIQIGGIYNHARTLKGLQTGLVNKSEKLRGVQIGLWNVSQKRKLPFINWDFTPKLSKSEVQRIQNAATRVN
jgi:TonB family protein